MFRQFALEAVAGADTSVTPITAGECEITVAVFGVYELLPSSDGTR